MKITELRNFSRSNNIEIIVENPVHLGKGSQLHIMHSPEGFLVADLSKKEQIPVRFEPSRKSDANNLHYFFSMSGEKLYTVLAQLGEKKYAIQAVAYTSSYDIDFNLAVDESIIASAKGHFKFNSKIDPRNDLREEFVAKLAQSNAVIAAYNTNKVSNEMFRSFYIVGKQCYLHIEQVNNSEKKPMLKVVNIVHMIDEDDYKFDLFKGDIDFVHTSEAKPLDDTSLAIMQMTANDINSYIEIWRKYSDIETEGLMEHLQKVGDIRYEAAEEMNPQQFRLDFQDPTKLKKFMDRLGEQDESFTLFSEKPLKLYSQQLTFKEYMIISNEMKKSKEIRMVNVILAEPYEDGATSIYVKIDKDTITLPTSGYMGLSLSGDINRIDRQQKVLDKIKNDRAARPNLRKILTDPSYCVEVASPRITPLTDQVRAKIFSNPPTPKQIEAIDVALNTPDIAIIQGPPGTGKTTVIRAILERLNDESKSANHKYAENLVTAFQHDAVQNVVERLDVMGLPSIKFGDRNIEYNEKPLLELTIEKWISQKQKELFEQYPSYFQNEYIEKFERLKLNYLYSANTKDSTIQILDELYELLKLKIPLSMLEKLREIRNSIQLSSGSFFENEELLRHLYGLPRSQDHLEDYGDVHLRFVRFYLRDSYAQMFEKELSFIDEFELAHQQNILTEKHFKQLLALRKSLIVYFIPKDEIFYDDKKKQDILDIFQEISNFLDADLLNSVQGEDQVVMEYIQQIQNNPLLVQETLKNYITVIGATNQQSVSNRLVMDKQEIRHEDKDQFEYYYENVIVDEAARSNPLDLFIPIALSKNRIILVGDHRQLPHIVDEGILQKIEQDVDEDEEVSKKIERYIKESLFQQLFKTMSDVQKVDGIQRVVTLDAQYRTHPLLGEFVSKHFYEVHNEVKIASPLPARSFTHQLPGFENKAAIFVNVPNEKKSDSEMSGVGGKSKKRPIEARRMVEHLKQMMDSEGGSTLTFGLITFYREQVNVINTELVKQKMAVKTENGIKILPHYATLTTKDGKKVERLRIGTVDAFQGMEFDIVYLSIVRSNQFPLNNEFDARKKYGFLMFENRLNVSMSRQKKALIMFGDAKMLEIKNVESYIPSLAAFIKLCKEDEVYGQFIQ